GKSLGNFITLDEFFKGSHKNPQTGEEMLAQPYDPMTIRFFILQAHYRSTVDFSNEALQAAEKGLLRMRDAMARLAKIQPAATTTVNVAGLRQKCEEAMSDDLNTPIVISHLFDAAKAINTVADGKGTISEADLNELRDVYKTFGEEIMGLRLSEAGGQNTKAYAGAIDLLLELRAKAKANKDWATSDQIRDSLTALGFAIKDTKDGAEWSLN
ncbi:MAG: cysteine--tRNA ligase, partial [Bacteroidales bacterium]|nr:cysteine--tRNA ligase [Bacteroidales bacterium]